MFSIFSRSLADFLDIRILLISLVPITAAALIWGIIFYIFSGPIDAALANLLDRIPYLNNELARSTIELVGGVLIYYELLIVTAVMIVGMIADSVVDRVNTRRYQLDKMGFGSLTGSLLISLKSNLLFLFLFVIFLPLIFIPVINIFVHLFLWMVLIKTPLFYDSIAMYASKNEYTLLKKTSRFRTYAITLAAASLFLIPVVGIFVYILQLLFYTHFNFQRLTIIRHSD